jgi:LacI family transcriptional regulator
MKTPKEKRAGKSATVTIEMVAKAAGVSPSTVSRILNGTAKVSEEKKSIVTRTIERLKFVPNPTARLLAMGRSMTIGVVAQSIDSPFYGEGLRGIEDVLAASEFAVLFTSGHWNARSEQRCVDQLLSRRVDGLIFLTTSLPGPALRSIAEEVPVVVTGRHIKGERLVCLEFDNEGGARLATEHLISLGHQKIAFVAGLPGHNDAEQRFKGYRQALIEAGLSFNPDLVRPGQYREAGGESAMYELLDSGQAFSAVIAANDQSAYGAMLALYRRGIRVPQDVSVVGFDDLLQSAYTIPPLTSVHQAIYETGQMAARAIVDLIAGASPNGRLPAPSLSIRESTRPHRG